MRKQTKLWKTREGQSIRICDMTDFHLINSIRYIERVCRNRKDAMIHDNYVLLSMLRGEQALYACESEIDRLEQLDESEFYPKIYENLRDEATRRKLKIDTL